MQGAGIDKEHITLMHRHFVADFKQRVILNAPLKLFLTDFLLEAIKQAGTGLAVHDVPHFRLAVLSFHPQSVFIVRVNLYRQISFGIDEFYQ